MKKLTLLFSMFLCVVLLSAQHTIDIEVKTDNYGSETSWELINVLTDEVIGSGGPYANVTGGTLYTFDYEVDGTGCYAFKIYDSYGDGICCSYGSGHYKVWYDEVLIGQGAQFMSVATVSGMGICPENEIKLKAISTPPFGLSNVNINITGSIVNLGSTVLSSFDLTYKVNDEDFVTTQNIVCNVANNGSLTFTHNIPFNTTVDGTYTITVMVSNPNGVDDIIENNLLAFELIIDENFVSRNVLLEHFSTGVCPNCPATTASITTWLSSRPDVIWVTHHAGYGTDPMTIPENTELLLFYNAGGSIFAPAMMLDRVQLSPDGEPGPVFYPASSFTPGLIDKRINLLSPVTLSVTGIHNSATGEIEINVEGEVTVSINDEHLRLSVFLIEDGVVGTQSGVSGSYTHNNVMRDAVSATFGDTDVITSNTAGTSFNKTYNYTLNAAWNASNMSVVAFVNNWDPASVNNREVMNAFEAPLSTFVNTSDNVANIVKIFPNPASDILNINYVNGANISIFNNIGQEVIRLSSAAEYNTIDISSLKAGSYFVKITKDNSVQNHKIILVK